MPHLDAVLSAIPDLSQLLKAIIRQAPVGVQIYDSNGYNLYANAAHARMFGAAPPPGYCVLKDDVVAAQGWLPIVHKAFNGEPSRLPLFWYDVRDLKDLPPDDLAFTQRVGKKCAIETDLVPVFSNAGAVTHVLFLFRDVTAEQFMQKERDDANTLMRSVLDHTQAVVYIKDLAGRMLFVNRQYCRIFGLAENDVMGKTDYDLFPAAVAEAFRRNDLAVQLSLTHLEVEERAIHSDGSEHVYLSLKFPLLDSAGELYGTCGVSTDVTQRRRLEQEVESSRRKEAIGLLAGGVAHDFGNILSLILLNSDLLLKTRKTLPADTALELLHGIKESAQKASLLTQQLLAFGRRKQLASRVLELSGAFQSLKPLLDGALGEDVAFEIDCEDGLWSVRADPLHLEQIVTNLCLNSRDAMPKGGRLRISARNALLPIGASKKWRIGAPAGKYVELSVSDTGTGMTPEILERIFEPFFSTKPVGHGTGLGLASVLGLVESNGGDIAVESEPGKGTTFFVCFPCATELDQGKAAKPRSGRERPRATESVLLIEDQPALRRATAMILEGAGYKVFEAAHGAEALRLWRSGLEIHLIVSDVVMPGQSGDEVIRQMNLERPLGATRVLFVSGYSREKLSSYDLDRETLHFLEKPYTADALLTKLRAVLDSPVTALTV